jgi:hypothetical protein
VRPFVPIDTVVALKTQGTNTLWSIEELATILKVVNAFNMITSLKFKYLLTKKGIIGMD